MRLLITFLMILVPNAAIAANSPLLYGPNNTSTLLQQNVQFQDKGLGSDFIGTLGANDLVFQANGVEYFRITSAGVLKAAGLSTGLIHSDVAGNLTSSGLIDTDIAIGAYGSPVSVGSANADGVATTISRSDHIHQGVHSIAATGFPALYSDVLITGTGVTQVGQTITIPTGSSITPGSITTTTVGLNLVNGAGATAGPATTIDIQNATGAQPGLLTAADWNTFNSKEPAIVATTSADYYRGDKTFQNFNSAVQAAISASLPIVDTAGVFSLPLTTGHFFAGVAGVATDRTATQATALLDVMVGDSGAGGTKGLAPAPGAGDAAAGKFLSADGTYAVPSSVVSSGGVVTFVQSGGTSVMDDFGNPYTFTNAATLSTVTIGMLNAGSTGNTNFNIKQYRAGVLHATVTGSVPSNGGLPYGGSIALSAPLNLLTNDVITANITSVATGTPQDLSILINSGTLAGGIGPTGASAVPVINGTASAPVLITAAGGIPFTGLITDYNNIIYISGNGGPISPITANPQIAPCLADGQTLKIISENAVNTVSIANAPANGVVTNGTWVGGLNKVIKFTCDSNFVWVEESRQ